MISRIRETIEAGGAGNRRGAHAGMRPVLSILVAPFATTASHNKNNRGALSLGVLSVLGIFVLAQSASAQGVVNASMTPLQLSIAAGYSQLFQNEVPVYGLRTSMLWGEQEEVNGLDVGFFHTAVRTNGLAVGIYNGLTGKGTGIQLGLSSYVQESFKGLQTGIANAITGDLHGAQIGVANQAGSGAGFQLGALNITESMKGIQIGLWNVNPNGFLPYFPLFNFGFGEVAVDEED